VHILDKSWLHPELVRGYQYAISHGKNLISPPLGELATRTVEHSTSHGALHPIIHSHMSMQLHAALLYIEIPTGGVCQERVMLIS